MVNQSATEGQEQRQSVYNEAEALVTTLISQLDSAGKAALIRLINEVLPNLKKGETMDIAQIPVVPTFFLNFP